MIFDWPVFLRSRGIPFQTSGPHVGTNHIVIHCPFCGTETTADYMSISLHGKGWRCFRKQQMHKGGRPTKLIQALLGCSWAQACEIAGDDRTLPTDLLGAISAALEPAKPAPSAKPRKLVLPNSFRWISPSTSALPFVRYLQRREFTDPQIFRMTNDYDVRYCTAGAFKGRVIFPVYHKGKLVTWTGRAIGNQGLRYKALSRDPDKAIKDGMEPALGSVNDLLLWHDELMDSDADTICVVEGPFDALKTNILGRSEGIAATCIFTNSISPAQIELLRGILPRFKRRFLLLDVGTLDIAAHFVGQMKSLRLIPLFLPPGFKDPGELTREALVRLVR